MLVLVVLRSHRASPLPVCPGVVGTLSHRYRTMPAVRACVYVSRRAFNPDLILLSAGFDGGGVDQGNVKLVDETRPNGLDLEESDFAWLTASVLGTRDLATQRDATRHATMHATPTRRHLLRWLIYCVGWLTCWANGSACLCLRVCVCLRSGGERLLRRARGVRP